MVVISVLRSVMPRGWLTRLRPSMTCEVMCRSERQVDRERRPLDAQGAAVTARDHRGDRQPEARARPVGAGRAAVEALEDPIAAGSRRPGALVADDELRAVA